MVSLFRFSCFLFSFSLKLKQNPPYQSTGFENTAKHSDTDKIAHDPFSSGIEIVGSLKSPLAFQEAFQEWDKQSGLLSAMLVLHSINLNSALLIVNDPLTSRWHSLAECLSGFCSKSLSMVSTSICSVSFWSSE